VYHLGTDGFGHQATTTLILLKCERLKVIPISNSQQKIDNIINDATSISTYLPEAGGRVILGSLNSGTKTVLWAGAASLLEALIHSVRNQSWKEGFVALMRDIGMNTYEAMQRKNWTILLGSAVLVPCANQLYGELCVGPDFDNYESWYISRIATIVGKLQIPSQYHDDPILKKNVCLLCRFPIRTPLRDPHGNIFEAALILAYVGRSHKKLPFYPGIKSPGNIISKSVLKIDDELHTQISSRLKELGFEDEMTPSSVKTDGSTNNLDDVD
jgi:hypothetical protein